MTYSFLTAREFGGFTGLVELGALDDADCVEGARCHRATDRAMDERESERRRGFCPGVWTPMQAGDGLIVRVHPTVSGLTSADLRALAELALRYGNGELELTRRANVQLRGVTPETLAPLQRELVARSLAAPEPQERVRRLLLVDAGQWLAAPPQSLGACALGPWLRALTHALSHAPCVARLAPKTLVIVDGDESALFSVAPDVRLTLRDERVELRVASDAGEALLGACTREAAPGLLVRLLAELSECGEAARMRALVRSRGSSSLRSLLAAELTQLRDRARSARAPLGFWSRTEVGFFGLGVPFGAAPAARFLRIAELADEHGEGRLFVAPRALWIAGVRSEAAPQLARGAEREQLITSPQHALANVVACTGAPACASACGETRGWARELAAKLEPMLAEGATLHVSGCAKGCAKSARSTFTLLCDEGGVKLGLDADVAATAALPVESKARAGERLHALAAAYAKVARRARR